MRLLRLVLGLSLPVFTVAAYASPINFTETVTASGSLNGNAFTNQLVTVTGSGNTSAVTHSGNTYDLVLKSTTVQIGSGSAATFIDPIEVFDNQSVSAAGFEDTVSSDILDTFASVFATYNLKSSISATGSPTINSGTSFATSAGSFVLSSTSGTSTFTALASSNSTTPEPSALVLAGSGLLGLAGAVRRKVRGV